LVYKIISKPSPAVYPDSARSAEKMNSIYIVIVHDEEDTFEYEFGCLPHAVERYNDEQHAQLVEYDGNQHYLMEVK
jgi:hypothetical protein